MHCNQSKKGKIPMAKRKKSSAKKKRSAVQGKASKNSQRQFDARGSLRDPLHKLLR